MTVQHPPSPFPRLTRRELVALGGAAAFLGLPICAESQGLQDTLQGDWRDKTADVNGSKIHYVEKGSGPLVLLCHGFPEGWYSWRHQIDAIANAGYQVVAPDLRGYGRTGGPDAVEAYTIKELVSDVTGLLDALDTPQCVLVGHDFGAVLTWNAALLAPERFKALVAMSVPYNPRGSTPPVAGIRRAVGGNFNYIVYFQEPGVAERELESDVAAFLRAFYFSASAEGVDDLRRVPTRSRFAKMMETLVDPKRLPSWLSADDFRYYVGEFTRNGLARPLNWYRNLDTNWSLMQAYDGAKITHPTLFVAGEVDPVLLNTKRNFDRLASTVPGLVKTALIPDAGHWVQQEQPTQVNAQLIAFLKQVHR